MKKDLDFQAMLQAIEEKLIHQVIRLKPGRTLPFYDMLSYHMGWNGDESHPGSGGKRLRPLLVLLVTGACGKEWRISLPAAAAVELIHNFSLIHDDIQDNSTTRRGRETLWKKWGGAMAINAGDALFALANLSMYDLGTTFSPDIYLQSSNILHSACLDLTMGQFLDMEYQERNDISLADYWVMIEGKTAAIISASCELGAVLGGANEDTIQIYKEFGRYLGLAYQIQDDYLGIWGREEKTGKSTTSDLLSKKKTFPVIYCLEKGGGFSRLWNNLDISEQTRSLAKLLEEEGSLSFTKETLNKLTTTAENSLQLIKNRNPMWMKLYELLLDLERRNR